MSTGDDLKAQGMADVLTSVSSSWYDTYLDHAANYLRRNRFVSGEDLRLYCLRQGLKEPHHPNAWSAMFRQPFLEGWMIPTNEWIKPSDPTSHSRPIRFWRSTIYVGADAPEAHVYQLQGDYL